MDYESKNIKWHPWLQQHFEQIITVYETTPRRHHALLIQALPGMGDNALVHAIIRFIMCQNPEGHKNCGKCRSCQLMKAGMHPDYHAFEPKKNNTVVGIDAIRNISNQLYQHTFLGDKKVVWFNDASLLTESATNALLKIIEEPPNNTWFFLSCREPWHLSGTLRSRCCLYHLTIPKEKWALEWLQKEITVSKDAGLAALRLSGGAPIAALELLKKNHWTERTQLFSALNNVLKNNDWLSLLSVLNRDQATTRLEWLIILLLDTLKFQQGAINTVSNVDVWPIINSLAGFLTTAKLHEIVRTFCRCREDLLTITTLNRELILIDCLLVIENYLKSGSILPGFSL